MTETANDRAPKRRELRRFLAMVHAWIEALDYTSVDYTQDRIDLLERKVAALTKELRDCLASKRQ